MVQRCLKWQHAVVPIGGYANDRSQSAASSNAAAKRQQEAALCQATAGGSAMPSGSRRQQAAASGSPMPSDSQATALCEMDAAFWYKKNFNFWSIIVLKKKETLLLV
jgi:hypothetical protein